MTNAFCLLLSTALLGQVDCPHGHCLHGPHLLPHGQTWVDPAADLMMDPFAGADEAFEDDPQEIPRPPAPRVMLQGFSGGVPDEGENLNRSFDGELTSEDSPSFWTSVPYGPLRVLVQILMPAGQSESLGYVQLFLDGKALDNSTHLLPAKNLIRLDDTFVRITYTFNLPCPPTGRHLLQARYVKNDIWSEISPPLRFQVELPGTPKIVAVGDKQCAPMPIEHRRIVRVTTDTIVLKVAGVHPEGRLMAIVDGEPVQCQRVSNDCCYELRLTGLVEPGVHRIAVRTVSNNNCPITSLASKDIAVHYAPRHRYMVGLERCAAPQQDQPPRCRCHPLPATESVPAPRPSGSGDQDESSEAASVIEFLPLRGRLGRSMEPSSVGDVGVVSRLGQAGWKPQRHTPAIRLTSYLMAADDEETEEPTPQEKEAEAAAALADKAGEVSHQANEAKKAAGTSVAAARQRVAEARVAAGVASDHQRALTETLARANEAVRVANAAAERAKNAATEAAKNNKTPAEKDNAHQASLAADAANAVRNHANAARDRVDSALKRANGIVQQAKDSWQHAEDHLNTAVGQQLKVNELAGKAENARAQASNAAHRAGLTDDAGEAAQIKNEADAALKSANSYRSQAAAALVEVNKYVKAVSDSAAIAERARDAVERQRQLGEQDRDNAIRHAHATVASHLAAEAAAELNRQAEPAKASASRAVQQATQHVTTAGNAATAAQSHRPHKLIPFRTKAEEALSQAETAADNARTAADTAAAYAASPAAAKHARTAELAAASAAHHRDDAKAAKEQVDDAIKNAQQAVDRAGTARDAAAKRLGWAKESYETTNSSADDAAAASARAQTFAGTARTATTVADADTSRGNADTARNSVRDSCSKAAEFAADAAEHAAQAKAEAAAANTALENAREARSQAHRQMTAAVDHAKQAVSAAGRVPELARKNAEEAVQAAEDSWINAISLQSHANNQLKPVNDAVEFARTAQTEAQGPSGRARQHARTAGSWAGQARDKSIDAVRWAMQANAAAEAARRAAVDEQRRADQAPLNEAKTAKARAVISSDHATRAEAAALAAMAARNAVELARQKAFAEMVLANDKADDAQANADAATREYAAATLRAQEVRESLKEFDEVVSAAFQAVYDSYVAADKADTNAAAAAAARAKKAEADAALLKARVKAAVEAAKSNAKSARQAVDQARRHEQQAAQAAGRAEAAYQATEKAALPARQKKTEAEEHAGHADSLTRLEAEVERRLNQALVDRNRTNLETRRDNAAAHPDHVETKTIHFLSTAHFPLRDFGPNGEVFDREGLILYEDMEFTYKETGHYDVTFTTGTPKIPVTLRLRFLFQKQEDGPWYTITLKPIRIDVDPKQEIDHSQPLQTIKKYHVTGHSQALVRTPGKICNLKRDGSATFGFGVTALSHHQSH